MRAIAYPGWVPAIKISNQKVYQSSANLTLVADSGIASPLSAHSYEFLRLAVGLVGLAYFIRYAIDFRFFTATNGLVDHQLIRETFWFTAWPLLLPTEIDEPWIACVLLGFLACLGIAIGCFPRTLAFVAYLCTVQLYRRNFLVMYVDDALVHLLFFWTMLSPCGRSWSIRRQRISDSRILPEQFIGKCVALNLSVLYFVAGISKWMSPMWLDGTALAAVLKSGAAWPWTNTLPLTTLPMLKFVSWMFLILEPLFALIPFLRGTAQKLMLIAAVLFHVGIILTLDIVFANIGCLALLTFVYLNQPFRNGVDPKGFRFYRASHVAGAIVLTILTCASLLSLTSGGWRESSSKIRDAELGDGVYRMTMGTLWTFGIAQQYRLFDWIDERNYQMNLGIETVEGRSIGIDEVVSFSTRRSLLFSYLSTTPWAGIESAAAEKLKHSVASRLAMLICADRKDLKQFRVAGTTTRVKPTADSWGVSTTTTIGTAICDEKEVFKPEVSEVN